MIWLIKTLQADIWPVEHRICKSHPQFYEAEELLSRVFAENQGLYCGFSWREVKTGS